MVEVGPGPGGLTRALLDTAAESVTAIEIDRRAVAAIEALRLLLPDPERLRLLEAVERPSSSGRARAAALTPFLGWDAERVACAKEADWEEVHRRLHGWARLLRARGVAPEEAMWTVDGAGDLFGEAPPPPQPGAPAFTVPKPFIELAQAVLLHRSNERFALLYRLLWRLGREPDLMHIRSDPDVARALHVLRTPTTVAFDRAGGELLRVAGVPRVTELASALAPALFT